MTKSIYLESAKKQFEFYKLLGEKTFNQIQEEKLFENPELTLTDVAKKLKTNASIISKTINQGFQMNFNDCINNYRICANRIKKNRVFNLWYQGFPFLLLNCFL